jgi:hypothetical protein
MLTMPALLKQNSVNAYDASFAKAKLLGCFTHEPKSIKAAPGR